MKEHSGKAIYKFDKNTIHSSPPPLIFWGEGAKLGISFLWKVGKINVGPERSVMTRAVDDSL